MDVLNSALEKTPETNANISSNWKEKSLNLLEKFSSEGKSLIIAESSSILSKKKADLENKLSVQYEEISKIQKKIQDGGCKEEIKNKDKVDLYRSITHITWNHNAGDTDVSGLVSKPFNVFSLSTVTHSMCYITNYLWRLISGDVEAFASSV